jgi:hypothetical protein
VKISVTVHGITPLLMNRFTEENEIAVSGGTSQVLRGTRGTPREQAAPKRYCDKDGNLYFPGPNIFAAIIAAGKFHKAGRTKITTSKESLIPAGLVVEELVCSLGTKEWEVDSRSVVIPATGGRIMCHRPRIDTWSLTFTLDLDETVFAPDLIRAIIDDAGKKIGIGDYRPSRKGPFGRFVVARWEVLEQAVKKAA